MSSLGAIIPSAKGRKIAYAIYSLTAFLIGNAAIYYAATSDTVPMWIIGMTAVINNCAPLFGAVAIANAPTTPKEEKVAPFEVIAPSSPEVPFE